MSVNLNAGSSHINVSLSANSKKLEVTLAVSTGDVRLLPLHLTPTAEAQTVNAEAGKAYNRVDMDGIPYYETTNESGGYTVIIGE